MFQLALKADPTHIETLKAYARLMDDVFRDSQCALELCTMAYNMSPDDPALNWRLGRLVMEATSDYNRSEALFKHALEFDLDFTDALHDLGKIREEIYNDIASAERLYRRYRLGKITPCYHKL